MGFSLPNHDAKEQKGQTEKRQKTKQKKNKNQRQTTLNTVKAKKI